MPRRRSLSSGRCDGRDRRLLEAAYCKRRDAIKCQIQEMWNEISRERRETSLRGRLLEKEREKFEKKLGTLGPDIPLAVVAKQFNLLIADLTDTDALQHYALVTYPNFPSLYREIVQLHWRSRNMLLEFSGFNCTRLVLDKQSPLATQFVDFFTDLQWLLISLVAHIEASVNGKTDVPAPLNHIHACSGNSAADKFDIFTGLLERCHSILAYIKPIVFTCIVLHTLYKSSGGSFSEVPPFQRAVKDDGRMFTDDMYHCYLRSFGHLKDWNLDSFKDTRVEILEKEYIGQGGYASVCKGYFVQTGSGEKVGDPVAIKLICHPRSGITSDFLSDFFSSSSGDDIKSPRTSGRRKLRSYLFGLSNSCSCSCNTESELPHASELQKLASLQHPNIVEVKGYIDQRELMNGMVVECGIVMELMDGSLDKVIQKMQNDEDDDVPLFTELDIVDVMLEIARAIRFLHENGVTHRDLKPANILLRLSYLSSGIECLEIKVGDFGLTKCIHSQQHGVHPVETEHTACVGTSGFMAPEIRVTHDKVPYTDTVDIYSYGITCLDIITGVPHRKVESGKYKELYKAVDAGVWEKWLKAAMPGCPHNLIDVIRSCLQSEPTYRPTAAEICFVLQQIKWRLICSCPNETESDMEEDFVSRSRKEQLRDSVEQRIVPGLILGRVVSNSFSGTKLIETLLEEVPESAYTTLKVYIPAAPQDGRKEETMLRSMLQSQKWRNEVLVKAMKNVIAMKDSCETSSIISRSESLLRTLEELCNDLVEDIFIGFCSTRDLPTRQCDCVVPHHLKDQKLCPHLEDKISDITKGFPPDILKSDGIYRLCLFGELVDECFGVKHNSSTPTGIETIRDAYVRKYLLYHGLFVPILENKMEIGDAILEFRKKWVMHEVIFTLFRWSRLWKMSLNNVIQVPCAEDVVDYSLVCRSPTLSCHTVSDYFDLSLPVFLKARNISHHIDDYESSYIDEDESMLPLLKSFYMLYQ